MVNRNLILFLIGFLVCVLSSCVFNSDKDTSEHTSRMEFRFSHSAAGIPLVFDTEEYTNDAGNTFSISQLQYYISNFKIKDDNGDVIDSSTSSLRVNAKDPSTLSFVMDNLPVIHFHTINFTIISEDAKSKKPNTRQDYFILDMSVSVKDSSDVPQYITTKLNGTTPTVSNEYVFRSGGLHTDLEANKTVVVNIELDILKLFNSPNSIDLSTALTSNSLVTDSASQKLFRDNIRLGAFEVTSVTTR